MVFHLVLARQTLQVIAQVLSAFLGLLAHQHLRNGQLIAFEFAVIAFGDDDEMPAQGCAEYRRKGANLQRFQVLREISVEVGRLEALQIAACCFFRSFADLGCGHDEFAQEEKGRSAVLQQFGAQTFKLIAFFIGLVRLHFLRCTDQNLAGAQRIIDGKLLLVLIEKSFDVFVAWRGELANLGIDHAVGLELTSKFLPEGFFVFASLLEGEIKGLLIRKASAKGQVSGVNGLFTNDDPQLLGFLIEQFLANQIGGHHLFELGAIIGTSLALALGGAGLDHEIDQGVDLLFAYRGRTDRDDHGLRCELGGFIRTFDRRLRPCGEG